MAYITHHSVCIEQPHTVDRSRCCRSDMWDTSFKAAQGPRPDHAPSSRYVAYLTNKIVSLSNPLASAALHMHHTLHVGARKASCSFCDLINN